MTSENAQAERTNGNHNGFAGQPQTEPQVVHREGAVARGIEQQTAKMPSDYWLWAAIASMGLSAVFQMTGQEKKANFIGLWAPTLLIFGVYNKMVKLQGSDGV